MKNVTRKQRNFYVCRVLVALSLIVIAGCTQVPPKTKESPKIIEPPKIQEPPKIKQPPPTEVLIKSSV